MFNREPRGILSLFYRPKLEVLESRDAPCGSESQLATCQLPPSVVSQAVAVVPTAAADIERLQSGAATRSILASNGFLPALSAIQDISVLPAITPNAFAPLQKLDDATTVAGRNIGAVLNLGESQQPKGNANAIIDLGKPTAPTVATDARDAFFAQSVSSKVETPISKETIAALFASSEFAPTLLDSGDFAYGVSPAGGAFESSSTPAEFKLTDAPNSATTVKFVDLDACAVRSGVVEITEGAVQSSIPQTGLTDSFFANPNFIVPSTRNLVILPIHNPFDSTGAGNEIAVPQIYADDSRAINDTIAPLAGSTSLEQTVRSKPDVEREWL